MGNSWPGRARLSFGEVGVRVEQHGDVVVSRLQRDGQGGAVLLWTQGRTGWTKDFSFGNKSSFRFFFRFFTQQPGKWSVIQKKTASWKNGQRFPFDSFCFLGINRIFYTVQRVQKCWISGGSRTLSVRVVSQSGRDSSSLTMSAWPCSLAHISAVEPSSSRRLTSAPRPRRDCTMAILPWLTASIKAVWPAWVAAQETHFESLWMIADF